MNLEFNILWFDDEKSSFDSFGIDIVEAEIRDWGFSPKIKCISEVSEFNDEAPFQKFDLIVVDKSLQFAEGDGQDFIKQIRDNSVFTEIIFYSSYPAKELWKEIAENRLGGVFVANRNNIEDSIIDIGYQSIKKILDLDNMRGIVMAELGEFDFYLENAIRSGKSTLKDEAYIQITNNFLKNIKKRNESFSKMIDSLDNPPEIDDLFSLCDSYKYWRLFREMLKKIDLEKFPSINKSAFQNFNEDIIKKRNVLAHGIPEIQDDGSHLFAHKGEPYLFNEESSLELRTNIIKYKSELEEISKEFDFTTTSP